ncbi:MAG: thiamine phosphate synthase [Tepidisphaeraceae bacterium]|jgi:thiamine-phosphate pyrophosphorylase
MASDATVLRIIDANANRAREALRVVEDYARFVLNAADLSADLKNNRHELAEILRPILDEAILYRDTPADVGTNIKEPSETAREDLRGVVVAAGKRLGEALRTLEEYLKISDPADAARIEALRYRFYEIERRIALTLRPGNRFASVRLYVLISESACKIPWLAAAESAIDGGADCIQLREKSLESGEFLRRARQLVALCRSRGVLCIINDRPDIAALADADGVHLGQQDLPAAEARRILGSSAIIGVSTHNLSQARAAVLDGADYLGVGPIFKSPTKPRDFVAGLEYAAAAAKEIRIPLVAIAGIGVENVDEVLATGIRCVAVTAAVLGQPDVRAAAARMREKLGG